MNTRLNELEFGLTNVDKINTLPTVKAKYSDKQNSFIPKEKHNKQFIIRYKTEHKTWHTYRSVMS